MLGNVVKNFLKEKVAELEKKIQESPNKFDDRVWAFFKDNVIKWIESL